MSNPATVELSAANCVGVLQAKPESIADANVHGAMVALWVGEQAAVYLARAMKTIVVRHGVKPLSDADFREVTYVTTQTCGDTGIRTVLYDLRAASSRCDCKLCTLHDARAPGVLAAAQDTDSRVLTRAIRNFRSFKSAIDFVRPKSLVPTSVPCPWGFERILAEVQERGGKLAFSNYAGAVFELPKQHAVYLHWSGDSSEAANTRAVMDALDEHIAKLNASVVLVDHRHRVDADAALAGEVLGRDHLTVLKSVAHVVSIGDWPRGLDLSECLEAKDISLKVTHAATLKSALEKVLRTPKPVPKFMPKAQAA